MALERLGAGCALWRAFAVRATLFQKAGRFRPRIRNNIPHAFKAVVLKTPSTLEKVATAFVVLIAVAFGQIIYKRAVKAYHNFTNRPPVIAETAWTRHTLRDLNLDSPFRFNPPQDFRGKVPPEVQEEFELAEVYHSQSPNNLFIVITLFVLKPGIEASLEGAVETGTAEFAKGVGDPNPQYSSTPTIVGGMKGCRTAYRGTHKSGQIVHCDTLTVVDENKLWQVAVGFDSASVKDASRILDSVAITR